jgi:REP element-mobilizing transposase RayT
MPKPRKRLVSLQDTPYYHCIARCVRRAYLCGEDPVTGFNFEHRRQWLVERIKLLTSVFSMEVCAYAVMSNHYHVVLRIDAGRARLWSDKEVAKRWTLLFAAPLLVRRWLAGDQLGQAERQALGAILNEWRKRLYDLSWFMRCLNEAIARMANREDHCGGRFWEGRFKSQALLDEQALLACMAYVDLNPIRAAIATRPELSDYTSIQERIRQPEGNALRAFAGCADDEAGIPFALKDYLELVDWAGRAIRPDKTGFIPEHAPPVLQRLGMESAAVLDYLANKQQAQVNALGSIENMRSLAAHLGLKFIKGISIARKLCPSPG